MDRKKVIAGVAIGFAALAAVGIIAYKKRSKKARAKDKVEDYAQKLRAKLAKLEKKAKKEYAHILEEGEDFANTAKTVPRNGQQSRSEFMTQRPFGVVFCFYGPRFLKMHSRIMLQTESRQIV